MENLSSLKQQFLTQLGIDINNTSLFSNSRTLPIPFRDNIERKLLMNNSLTGTFEVDFCLRDLAGTIHPDYNNISWLEMFKKTKRGDDAVRKYFENPSYYETTLKEDNQSDKQHDSPIELYKYGDSFYVKGGNNRIGLIMMKYLAELSKATTDEEKQVIYSKYTFKAKVNPIPKDLDVTILFDRLYSQYNNQIVIKNIASSMDEFHYSIKLNDQVIIIKNKEELQKMVKKAYGFESIKDKDDLKKKLVNLLNDCFYSDAIRTSLKGVFPNLSEFLKNYLQLQKDGLVDEFYNKIESNNLNYLTASKMAEQLVNKNSDKSFLTILRECNSNDEIKQRIDESLMLRYQKNPLPKKVGFAKDTKQIKFIDKAYFDDFIFPNTEISYTNFGPSYHITDKDYLYDFAIGLKQQDIKNNGDLLKYMLNFIDSYFGIPKGNDRREDIFASYAEQFADDFYASKGIAIKDGFTASAQMQIDGHLPLSALRGQAAAQCVERSVIAQNLLQLCGFESSVMFGSSLSGGIADNHAWNTVKLNDQYFIMDFSNIVYDYSNETTPTREPYFIKLNQEDYEDYLQGNKSIEGPSYYRKNLKQIFDGKTRQYVIGTSKEYYNNLTTNQSKHLL